MKFNKHRLALAASATAAILFVFHKAMMFFFPDMFIMLHMHGMNMMVVEVTPMKLLVCFVHKVVETYAVVWLFAYLFNHFEEAA